MPVKIFFTIMLVNCFVITNAQQKTYCNPINIDYTYMIYNAHRDISYRSGADPAVVKFRGEYYMFVTRSLGYWHSTDLLNWTFITPEKWYFEGCNAPAAHNYKDSVLYVAGNPSGSMSILYTDNPKKGDWKEDCSENVTAFDEQRGGVDQWKSQSGDCAEKKEQAEREMSIELAKIQKSVFQAEARRVLKKSKSADVSELLQANEAAEKSILKRLD